jgi:hypothetical protein
LLSQVLLSQLLFLFWVAWYRGVYGGCLGSRARRGEERRRRCRNGKKRER